MRSLTEPRNYRLVLSLAFFIFFFTNGARGKNFLTEKQLFEIEILDHTDPSESKKILDIVFNSHKSRKISKKKMLVLLYKYFLDTSYERIEAIKQRQDEGGHMSEEEEDILVSVHLLENYIDTVISEQNSLGRKIANELLSKDNFSKFTQKNHQKILRKLNDDIFNDPFALDPGIHHEDLEEKEEDMFDIDL